MGGYHSLPELRTAQPEDPLTALAKVAQVRAAMQQAAMAPGQMELQKQAIASGQQEATVRQRAMDEQSTLMQAMAENPGATIGQLVPVLAKSGKVTPQTIFALQQKDTEIRKNTAELDDKTLAVKTAAHAQLQNLYNNAMQMDDQTLAQNWPAIVGQVKTLPGIDKAATMFDPAQPMTREQLQQYGPVLGLQDAYLKNEAAKREATAKVAGAEAELPGKVAESTIKTQDAALSPAARALKNQSALEYYAGQDDPAAKAALAEKIRVAQASRPVNVMGMGGPSNAKDIANSIIKGDQPPDLSGLGRGDTGLVRGELARQGYNLVAATTDWKAVQKQIATLNGPQQTRLRQSIQAAGDMLDKVESLYDQWQKLAPQSGYKVLNKATLAAMKQMPGQPGAIAQALDAQIADLTSDLGNIYMGGNSPTDHSLALAQKSLSADWNDASFREGLTQARANVKIRYNSILNTEAAGTGGNSQYMPKAAPQGGTIRARDPQGKLHEAPAGTALPAGWKLEQP